MRDDSGGVMSKEAKREDSGGVMSKEARRQLLILRHGERCDFTFNGAAKKSWVRRAFDEHGIYTPFDINLPHSLPKRKDGWEQYERDTPLTEIGYLQSKLAGRSIGESGICIDHVYSSNALRSLQTAIGILKGLGNSHGGKSRLNIEPGLFEWMQWMRGTTPCFMAKEDLIKNGYPINASYVPVVKEQDLCMSEDLQQYYQRSEKVVRSILQSHPTGSILLVGHSGTLEACTRQLCGGEPRSIEDFCCLVRSTPYLGTVRVSETRGGGEGTRRWKIQGSPILPLTHSSNATYDPNLLSCSSEELRKYVDRAKK